MGGQLTYTRDPGLHLIFGYLEIEAVMPLTGDREMPEWLRDHPHAHPVRRAVSTNTLYLARKVLSSNVAYAWAGTFSFGERRIVTAAGMSRSRWRLDPRLFGMARISYHDGSAWRDGYFQSYPKAQEDVIEADKAIRDWAVRLICE
jgi:hypothetical protein